MTIIYTPTVGSAYDFERGLGDIMTGVVKEHLTASYRSVNLALLEGSISIKVADMGSAFSMNVTLNNSQNGVDTDTTSDAKYIELLALQGTIGSLVKEGITVTNCQLKSISKSSRKVTSPSFPIAASTNFTIIATILFEKLDA